MTKFILIMIICSGIPGNECKPMPTPFYEFKTYSECILYGYDHSSEILRAMGQDFVEEHRAFTAFDCKEQSTI
jgi:hypothetical protein|tara:strand:+ start:1205 stop:1423 length:219 start_codon:yes stop_codon:yes gene_type:complete